MAHNGNGNVNNVFIGFQLTSELIVLTIRPEDDGTFFCAAQNPAGVARANFTVRVLDSLENPAGAAGGTSGGLQENTDLYGEEGNEMFKVLVFHQSCSDLHFFDQ